MFAPYYFLGPKQAISNYFSEIGAPFLNSTVPKALTLDPPFPLSVEICACDVIPSYPTVVRLCNQAFPALPVTQVSVERIFSAMRLLL